MRKISKISPKGVKLRKLENLLKKKNNKKKYKDIGSASSSLKSLKLNNHPLKALSKLSFESVKGTNSLKVSITESL